MTPARGPRNARLYGVDDAFMQFQRHERVIDIV